jgi:hypothetical protein
MEGLLHALREAGFHASSVGPKETVASDPHIMRLGHYINFVDGIDRVLFLEALKVP